MSPAPGLKLYEGQSAEVRVRIESDDPAVAWRVQVDPLLEDVAPMLLKEGVGPVDDFVAGSLDATTLEPGKRYEVVVETESERAAVPLRVPDSQYALIPKTSGNFDTSQFRMFGQSVDRNGRVVMYGALSTDAICILDRWTGQVKEYSADTGNSWSLVLSGDGKRFFHHGGFRVADYWERGLGFLDLASGEATLMLAGDNVGYFSVDDDGNRVVYQRMLDRHGLERQYFLYDQGVETQLTPSITLSADYDTCPRLSGTKPLISADGNRVVFVTDSTLGFDSIPAKANCKVFIYDVPSGELRFAFAPAGARLAEPTLSDDGRWLSFVMVRVVPPNIIRPFGALLDLERKKMVTPIGDIEDYSTFDAKVTPDGSKVIVSTNADLDPRVGNEDHNMEIFIQDRETGEFTQVTDTTGGIGRHPGGCPNYAPSTDGSGGVILFELNVFEVGSCQLDGPQLSARNGMSLRHVRAVKIRPGNQGPVLALMRSTHAEAGRVLRLPISATDPEGDPISLFVQMLALLNIPEGSTVIDNRDGTGVFEWQTDLQDVGTYEVRVAAFDEAGGEVFQDVTLVVAEIGDCNVDTTVTVDELIRCVSIALGEQPVEGCRACDGNGDAEVTVDELLRGVNAAL